MGKYLFIAEKPSVAQQFAATLGESMSKGDGYQESEHLVVTWCLGHLVTMSYPEVYDQKYKKWSLDTLPFIPSTYKYEVIGSAKAVCCRQKAAQPSGCGADLCLHRLRT